jgi:hypothetical protein
MSLSSDAHKEIIMPQANSRRSFMDTYFTGSCDIIDRLRGELEHIGELTTRAADVIRGSGVVYASINFGHMPEHETAARRRGNPGIMKEHGGWASTDFAIVKPGDMVFTNDCARKMQAARDRGAYVVAVTCSYINNEFRPQGVTCPNEDDLLLHDVANDILHSHVPYEQGIVLADEIPGVTLCPSATTGAATLFWMLTGELANKLHHPHAPAIDKSAAYIAILRERVERIATHMDLIQDTARIMARRIRDGGTWHVQSLEYPGLASELHSVECGPMIVNNLPWIATKPNVLLVSAISPAHRDEVELARDKRHEGAYVIAVGPSSLDGRTPTDRLLDVANVGFDNFSPESRGVINIEGCHDAICPTSGIVANIIQQMICAQWADEMIRHGSPPHFFKGVNQVGGRDFNAMHKPDFERRGY